MSGHTISTHRRLPDHQLWAILVYSCEQISVRQVTELAARAECKLRKNPIMRQLALEFSLDADAPEHDASETWPCIECKHPFNHTGFYWSSSGTRTSRCLKCHSVRTNRKP